MNGYELNKIAGAILLAGVLAMTAATISNIVYHDEPLEKRGYQIEGAAEEAGAGAVQEEAEPIDLATLLAAASADKGKKVAKKCLACHSFDAGGPNKVGPALHGILGDSVARNGDFVYSKAFTALEGGWGYDNLYDFLKNPKKYAPGTKMAFVGVRKPEQLADLLLYIRQQGSSQYPLPAEGAIIK